MNEKEIIKNVELIFRKLFSELKDSDLDLEKKQNDFENWDSFAHMELVGKVEQKFSINLDLDEVIELDSPKKFIKLISEKLS
jgi:acyl carrier protein